MGIKSLYLCNGDDKVLIAKHMDITGWYFPYNHVTLGFPELLDRAKVPESLRLIVTTD
jgi:hypothetical protein